VYRYILDNKNSELVTLQEELDFIDHYIYLLKIRFDNAISFSINIDENKKNAYIPPLCLQMLVENSIQHNEASSAKTLFISIFAHNDSLTVENNIQGRMEKAESSKTGLKNIVSRYAYFTDKKVEIINNGKTFKVTLPLIHTR
jgi:LytS/YehU family sensor histidine kinase